MSEHWALFLFLAALIAAWSGLILGVMRAMLTRCMRGIDSKIEALAKLNDDYRRVEREVLELKAELPNGYVRREDFIREETVILVKLDKLRDLIEDKVRAN